MSIFTSTTPHSGSYLIHRPSGYMYRMKVPLEFQDIVGKTELRYSLKTGFLRDAKSKAKIVAGQVHELFRRIRIERESNSMTIDKYAIEDLVRGYINEVSEEVRDYYAEYRGRRSEFQLNTQVDAIEDERDDLRYSLMLNDLRPIQPTVEHVLESHGLEP